jgi:predicted transcriptional regulator of viral defense system
VVQVRTALLQRIAALAERQFGVVTHGQLIALGLSRSAIRRWLKQGRLHRLHRGVYLLGRPVPAPLALEQGALLAAGGDDAALSHFTAARLDGFIEEEDGAAIHVTTARFRGRPTGVVVHTSRRLEPRDVRWLRNLPVTTPARTLLDLAEVADARTLERAVETALARRRVTERQLREIIKRLPGRKGGRRLAAFLDYRGAGFTRSHAEDRLRALLKGTGLPEATFNDRVAGYEVDAHFRTVKVVVEVDSLRWHHGQAALTRDRRKWADLDARGYKVVPVTAWELDHEPHVAIARIATAVALASAK